MTHNPKVWVTNLIFVPALPALVYGITFFINCGFLCINRLLWGYWTGMSCLLVFAVVNAVFYKHYKSKVALILFVFWVVLFLMMLVVYIFKI